MLGKDEVRAISLGLALYFLNGVPYHLKALFGLADRFQDFILYGQWPKEAIGGEEGDEEISAEALLSAPSALGQQAGKEEG